MDAIERIRVHTSGELPMVFVVVRSEGPEPIRGSPDWMTELRSAIRQAGLPTVPGAAHLVVIDRAAAPGANHGIPILVDWEPERRVDFDWPELAPAEILRALESQHFNVQRAARRLFQREKRGREKRETRDDPEYRANLHATAFAVGLALLGFGLVLQTFFRAN